MNAETFNTRYPVGTPVVAYPCARPQAFPSDPRLLTRTRSKAAVLGGHTDVVWVDGHSACIALSQIDVVTEAEVQAAQPMTDTATTVRDLETVEPSRCTCLTPQYDYTHKSPSCPYFGRPTETPLSKEREAYIREFANPSRPARWPPYPSRTSASPTASFSSPASSPRRVSSSAHKDRRIIDWLADWGGGTVLTIASLLQRATKAGDDPRDVPAIPGWGGREEKTLVRLGSGSWYDLATGLQDGSGPRASSASPDEQHSQDPRRDRRRGSSCFARSTLASHSESVGLRSLC